MTKTENNSQTTVVISWNFTADEITPPEVAGYSIKAIKTGGNKQNNYSEVKDKIKGLTESYYVFLHGKDFNSNELDELIKKTDNNNEVYFLPFGGGNETVYEYFLQINGSGNEETRAFKDEITISILEKGLNECKLAYHILPKLVQLHKIMIAKRLDEAPNCISGDIITYVNGQESLKPAIKALKTLIEEKTEVKNVVLQDDDNFIKTDESFNTILDFISNEVIKYGA